MLMGFVPYIWVLWIPLVAVLFPTIRARRAIIAAFVVGILFLPESPHPPELAPSVAALSLPGLHFTKENVVCYAAFLGIVLYDFKGLANFQVSWIDIPMLVW